MRSSCSLYISFTFSVQQTSDGSYILGGKSYSKISGDKTEGEIGGGTGDYWVVKLAFTLSCYIPAGQFTSQITATTAKTNWDPVNPANKYKLRYKPSDTNTWTTISVNPNYKKLTLLSPETEYDWQVKSICNVTGLGTSDWSSTQNFTTASLKLTPQLFTPLFEIYPNPVARVATIQFSLGISSDVEISLLDLQGRILETVFNEHAETGMHKLNFDCGQLPPGMYILKMRTSSTLTTQSIILQY